MKIRNRLSKALAPVLLGCALGPAVAQGQDARPDTSLGQRIAANGNASKGVLACVTCHGAQGEGNAAGGFPRLVGQSAAYTREQLDAYADGRRQNPIMAPIAKGLAENERAAVAAYYEQLRAPAPASGAGAPGASTPGASAPGASAPGASAPGGPAPNAPAAGASGAPGQAADARKRGETLFMAGDESLHVQGCVNCHGPGGAGLPPSYPYLGGQHAGYLAAALREFKSGTRNTDASGQMPYIARQLGDADIDAVAGYLAQLPPPVRDDAEAAAIRQRAAQGAATPSPRQAGPAAPTGTGTEQGSPLTGGGQGPGGGGGGSGTGASGSPNGR
ncbi:Cytochrome c domain-containing protein [Bordetella sputigena]|uniref:c-type cytochrome n=1 Tax=Bordetella sputigena TaxID=1416810 RepID=UPI0039EE66B3